MTGKQLLAKLLGTGAATAAVVSATAVAAGVANLSEEESQAGTSEMERLVAAAYADGEAAGVTAERERYGAVLTDPAAADNMSLAITLLSTTDNTPDQIRAAMAANGPRTAAVAAPAAAPTAPAAPIAPQANAADPLKAVADPIAGSTPLVDLGTGGGGEAHDGGEAGQVDGTKLWDVALSREANALTAGGFAVAGYQPAAR